MAAVDTSTISTLIYGHSFIRRLRNDLNKGFDPRAQRDFRLNKRKRVIWFGIEGRTGHKSLKYNDLTIIKSYNSDIFGSGHGY